MHLAISSKIDEWLNVARNSFSPVLVCVCVFFYLLLLHFFLFQSNAIWAFCLVAMAANGELALINYHQDFHKRCLSKNKFNFFFFLFFLFGQRMSCNQRIRPIDWGHIILFLFIWIHYHFNLSARLFVYKTYPFRIQNSDTHTHTHEVWEFVSSIGWLHKHQLLCVCWLHKHPSGSKIQSDRERLFDEQQYRRWKKEWKKNSIRRRIH